MTKEIFKMARADDCKTIREVTLWYQGYLQGCIDTLKDEFKEGKDNDTNTNKLR